MKNSLLVAVVVGLVACSCTHKSTTADHSQTSRPPSASPSTTSSLGIAVSGRAPTPVETTAPGIQVVPPNAIPVTIGSHVFQIAANDWNTIFTQTSIPKDVSIELDPEFHATGTTIARFQYLGDAISHYMPTSFDIIGIIEAPVGGNVVSIIAVLNPSKDALKLNGLTQTVTESNVVVTRGTFYTASSSYVVVPANGIYFARLTSPKLAPAIGKGNINWSFHYTTKDCGSATC